MEPNHNGIVDGTQDFLEFPEIPANGNFATTWNQPAAGATQQQFYPPYGQQPSFPCSSHHQSYQEAPHYGHFQPSYPNPGGPYHPQPFPSQPAHQALQPPPSLSRPSLVQHQFDSDSERDYLRTPTSPFRDVSPLQRPYVEDTPMQRMQQLTRQQYGGPLAAAAAAADTSDAARTTRRISPPGRGRRNGGVETVRDVLHRQYLEQRRLEEQKQQQQQQSVQQGIPATPVPSFAPSPQLFPSIPSPAPLLEAPSAPPTPIFTFPTPLSPSPSGSASPLQPDASVPDPLASYAESLKRKSRLKTQTLMMSLHKANASAAEKDASVELLTPRALHQAAAVVQSLEAKEKASSSRKRPLAPPDRPDAPLKPGIRLEMNEQGEMVERLYVLVHHCNRSDPDYTPNGILMPYEQYKKEEKREDMVTFSYSSIATPHEYVDFRVKKWVENKINK